MMNIIVLSYDYPPNDGGISRLSASLLVELARRGHAVHVLTLEGKGREGPPRPSVPTSLVPRRGWRRDLATLRFILRQPRDSALLATVWNPEATLAWLANRSDQLWILAHGNEVMPYPPGWRYALRRFLRRRVLASARGVICNSQYTEKLVRAACPRARTKVIPLGVDTARFQSGSDKGAARRHLGLPEDKLILLSVSRVNAYKGHDVVLRALAGLRPEQRESLHYAIAGKGEHLEELRGLANRLGVGDQVSWLGFVAEGDLATLYASADLFVLCTREDPRERGVEGFGLAFLEAQAAGVPVLGTRAGGIPDAVQEGRGGWLVPQDDVAAVGDHLERLISDPASFVAAGKVARRRVESECGWDAYASKVSSFLDEAEG